MEERIIIEKTADYVKGRLKGESTGHDWWHACRVWKNAVRIARHEACNLCIVELAALLHDVADWKFNGGDETAGAELAREWLVQFDLDRRIIDEVVEIVHTVSFKGANTRSEMKSIEGKIVQDADRIDAMGAIGIARTFAYGGKKGREMYNPAIAPVLHNSFEEYKSSNSPTINHFYEKLLLLKDLMNTESGRKIAADRDRFMRTFLDQFFQEFDGEDCAPL